MKQILSLCCTMLVLVSVNNAQTKTINIYEASLSYDSYRNRFTVSNIVCGLLTESGPLIVQRFQEPCLRVLIETGDGRCIDTSTSYSKLKLNEGKFVIPHTYQTNAVFPANARLVKTYDKGGPRTRMLHTNATSTNANPHIIYPPPPGGKILMMVVPSDIVPGDTMTGVITVKSEYVNNKFFLFMHDSLSVHNVRVAKASVDSRLSTPGDETGNPGNDSTKVLSFELSNRERAGSYVNVFFEVVPAIGLTNFEVGRYLTFSLNGTGESLQLVDSHDPNELTLLRPCVAYSFQSNPPRAVLDTNIRTLYFKLDMENTGLAMENDIKIALRFRTSQLQAKSIKFTRVIFRGEDSGVVMIRNSNQHIPNNLPVQHYIANVVYRCSTGFLPGTNQLPTGHPKTKAVIYFTIKTQNHVRFHDILPVSAVIWFGQKPTRTSLIPCRLMDVNNPCNTRQSN